MFMGFVPPGALDGLNQTPEALKPVTDLGAWRYVMVPAPDDVLIELYEVTPEALPETLRDYF